MQPDYCGAGSLVPTAVYLFLMFTIMMVVMIRAATSTASTAAAHSLDRPPPSGEWWMRLCTGLEDEQAIDAYITGIALRVAQPEGRTHGQ